jgi:chemotaxis protein histidine kinase CheA
VAIRLAIVGVALVSGLAALVVLGLRLWGAWYPLLLPEAALGAVVILSVLTALIWPLPDRMIAASADRRLGLRDRIGSAVQFIRGESPSGMERATILDALRHLGLLRPSEAFPYVVPQRVKVAGLCLAALFLAQFLPIPALLLSKQEREEKAELQEHAARIEPLVKELEQTARQADDEEAQEVARELRKLMQQLQRGQLDKKRALLAMAELEEKLERVERRAEQARPKTAHEAAEKLQRAAQESLASKARGLARQAREQGDQRTARQLEQIAKRADKAEDPSELQDLAEQLNEKAAELGASLGLPPEVLSALSEFFGGGELELSEEALRELEQMSQNVAEGSLGAEDLELLAMEIEQLSELLSDTELAEMAELLKQAAECMNAGDALRAGQYLKEALGLCQGKLGELGLAGACRASRLGLAQARRFGYSSGYGRGGPMKQDQIPPNAPPTMLFAPRQSDNPGDLARVRAQINPQGPMLTTTEKGAPTKVTESRVPYYEVIGEYSKAAEDAMSREEVPPAYRSTVRAYFRALQSDEAAAEE